MRNPSSSVFQTWQELMASGLMVGQDRPVGRVTYTDGRLEEVNPSVDASGPYREVVESTETELPFVVEINITRQVSQDAATCTITFINDSVVSNIPEGVDSGIFRPGYLTPSRGDEPAIKQPSVFAEYVTAGILDPTDVYTNWDYSQNPYYGVLRPNRVLKTYQGYGSDNFDSRGDPYAPGEGGYVLPQNDTKLVRTGVWLIDNVSVSATSGTITVECRDLGKLLIEQYVFPPSIPMSRFPLYYEPLNEWTETITDSHSETVVETGVDVATPHSTSNDVWYGANATIYGHNPSHAFDGNPGTYWMSVGNGQPNAGYSYEWIQASTKGDEVTEVLLDLVGHNYTIWVSVMENGVWQGSATVPYVSDVPPAFPNGANIPWVVQTTNGSSESISIKLPRAYNAQFVRVCFTNLWFSGVGTFKYRAAVREFRVRYNRTKTNTWTVSKEVPHTNAGNPTVINDWSDAVKEIIAWAGFLKSGVPIADPMFGTNADTGQPLGIWGQIEVLGTPPKEPTAKDWFVNKSFMEAIRQLKDALGAVTFIDENGGFVWRMPNIFTTGNFISNLDNQTSTYQNEWPIEFHENMNLMDYSITINDSQVRSEILVVGAWPDVYAKVPNLGGYDLTPSNATVAGIDFSDLLAGQVRPMIVPGESSKGFKTKEECQRMAELTAVLLTFTLRKGRISSPAHPGLQLDDQIRVYERMTHDFYVHYVTGVNTQMNLASGQYTMDVDTHWLGEDPTNTWFLGPVNIQETDMVKQFPALYERMGS